MNKHKRYLLVILIFSFFISGCSSGENSISKENDGGSVNQDFVNKEEIKMFSSLSINHRCIGCGRCVRVDQEHFIYGQDGKANVISENNLDSSTLRGAISICPTDAIILL